MPDFPNAVLLYDSATDLPEEWDTLCGDNPFMDRASLRMLEIHNPCRQRYFMASDRSFCFVMYRLKLDLLSFVPWPSLRLPVWILGLPLSVCEPGYALNAAGGGSADPAASLSRVLRRWPHFFVLLNAKHRFDLPGSHTLSGYGLPIVWPDFASYLAALRSSYRRAAVHSLHRFKDVRSGWLDSGEFADVHYQLYLQVFRRSDAKLECLPSGFFRTFPSRFAVFSLQGKVIAWLQLYRQADSLHFMFGGFDSSFQSALNLYPNLLLFLVREAIESGCRYLYLGQTADDSKTRLGAVELERRLYVWHPAPPLRFLLTRLVACFGWRPGRFRHRVFKERT